MNNNEFIGLIVTGILGAITNIIHGLYRSMKYNKVQIALRFLISILAICPAYIFCEYMKFGREIVYMAGYLSGLLGDRLINEIYRREGQLYKLLAGQYEDKKQEQE